MDIGNKIPNEVKSVLESLRKAGFKAYAVGGAVRDILIGREPKDWDVTTNAKPEDIQKVFPDSMYENQFGTVGVKTRSDSEAVKIIEVTTFRKEGGYSDFRHPDEIKFADSIEDDLSRRDFTVNAIALFLEDGEWKITDPFKGSGDIEKKLIKTVGDPEARFKEDALRLMRAVRFAAELGFNIDSETFSAISENADLLSKIAMERIRDELVRIIMSDDCGPAWGISCLEALGLLRHIIPELRDGIGVSQNKHHIYTVWEHNLRALDYAAKNNYSLEVRLASLLHDVGKPKSKFGEGPDATFYNHEVIGARMTAKIMKRLKFSNKVIDKVVHLVRHHLFYYNVGEVTEAGVRRFINRVGEEYIDDLFKIREADRIGSGVPKAVPYKTRHLRFMIDKVKKDPVGPGMLKVDGSALMKELSIDPGPRIGMILSILLEEVLDNPEKNIKENLLARAKDLNKLTDKELSGMAKKAKERKLEFEEGLEKEMKKRHKV
ncbi:MAG: HD domain-containing protein [Candidatus Colwellbacteria bacterium]|jgi:poly(A) polymerase/tRNA nucleotidyltransferase (CCA-adding enzyme)|nr:HD domain-containing protein [Candidatus Colwellbacteria bacterium]